MGRRRKNGEGTIRLRKDGRWEGRVVIGYDDQGLPKTKNVLARTKGECTERLKALKDTVSPAIPAKAKADMPFGQWMEFWYQTCCKAHVRANTQRGYERMIRLYILPRLGDIPLNKLTTQELQQFFTWMKTDARTRNRETQGEGVSSNQIRNCYGLCKNALEKAVSENLISRNPAFGCRLAPGEKEEMKILTREETQRLLIQAKEEGYYEVFLVELATGLRLGELMALQWDDLNLATGELRVDKQVTRVKGETVVSEPKTRAAIRTLILPPSVMRRLREYRAGVNSRWLFPSPRKEDAPIDPSVVRQRLYKLLEHAGCQQVRFHDLRHLFATNALAHGMDIKTLSTILGHVSSSTTLNIYAHITDTMRQAAAVKIDQGIAGVDVQPDAGAKQEDHTMTTFQARKRWQRKAG